MYKWMRRMVTDLPGADPSFSSLHEAEQARLANELAQRKLEVKYGLPHDEMPEEAKTLWCEGHDQQGHKIVWDGSRLRFLPDEAYPGEKWK